MCCSLSCKSEALTSSQKAEKSARLQAVSVRSFDKKLSKNTGTNSWTTVPMYIWASNARYQRFANPCKPVQEYNQLVKVDKPV